MWLTLTIVKPVFKGHLKIHMYKMCPYMYTCMPFITDSQIGRRHLMRKHLMISGCPLIHALVSHDLRVSSHPCLGVSWSPGVLSSMPWCPMISGCPLIHALVSHDLQVSSHPCLGVSWSPGVLSSMPWCPMISGCPLIHALVSHDLRVSSHPCLGVSWSPGVLSSMPWCLMISGCPLIHALVSHEDRFYVKWYNHHHYATHMYWWTKFIIMPHTCIGGQSSFNIIMIILSV